MPSWLLPILGAVPPLLWAVYQHFHPRIQCKLHYVVTDIREENHPRRLTIADAAGIYGNTGGLMRVRPETVNLVGKVFELRSLGNISAKGILIHVRLRYPVYDKKIETDEEHGKFYGDSEEVNIKVDSLNPTDRIRLLVFCDEDKILNNDDIELEHRITLSEGKAKRLKHWK